MSSRGKKIARKSVIAHVRGTINKDYSKTTNEDSNKKESAAAEANNDLLEVIPIDASERVLQTTKSFLAEKFEPIYFNEVRELLNIPVFPFAKLLRNRMSTVYVVGIDKNLQFILKKQTPGRDCLCLYIEYKNQYKNENDALKFLGEFKMFELTFQRLNFAIFGN